MTEKEFKRLELGNKVALVSIDKMITNSMFVVGLERWAGQVVTIDDKGWTTFTIEEDDQAHVQYLFDIDMIDHKVPSDAAIDKLAEGIFGKPLKETAKERVQKELAELEDRTEKLSHAFAPLADKIGTETEAYSLLNLQLGVMRTYATILRRRLAIWKD